MNPIFESEKPDLDLWGNVIETPLFKLSKNRSKIRRRASLNPGPEGTKCGTCAHLVTHDTGSQKFFKCGLVWNGGKSSAPDIKKKNRSCESWQPKTEAVA